MDSKTRSPGTRIAYFSQPNRQPALEHHLIAIIHLYGNIVAQCTTTGKNPGEMGGKAKEKKEKQTE